MDDIGLVSGICYAIQFTEKLSDNEVFRVADGLINHKCFGESVEVYYKAIKCTVEHGEIPLIAVKIATRYNESEILDFLKRLAEYLDKQRPWV